MARPLRGAISNYTTLAYLVQFGPDSRRAILCQAC
jgi:hypothetical protein